VLSPLDVVGYSRTAFNILNDSSENTFRQIAALRDQAKPLVRAGLSTPERDTSTRIEEALSVLARADQLAGGARPREELREGWLFTRATWIDCLAVLGRSDEAERLWDDTVGRDWVGKFVEERKHTPLVSKFQVSEMAVVAAQRDLDELGAMAAAFQRDPHNSRYGNRLSKVTTLKCYAETGDRSSFVHAILG
jgi:pentatricopeptide repeat protein